MLYHYTSATLLEKIIASGKLLPSSVGGWRLLWATSSPIIDCTATCAHEPIIARFTLHECDFEPWTIVRSRYQQEESRKRAESMERFIADFYAIYRVDPQDWYVRYASLSADRWVRIETRDQRWQPYVSSSWQGPQLAPELVEMMDQDALAMERDRALGRLFGHQTEEEEEEEDFE